MITFNLLGPQPVTAAAKQRLVWVGLLTLGVALCVAHTAQSRSLARLAAQVEGLRSDTAQLSKRVSDAQRKARANTELAARLGLMERLGRNRGRVLTLLAGVGAAVPERMWLTQFSYSGDALSLSGVGDTPEHVAAFLTRLRSSAGFAGIELVDLKREPSTVPNGQPQCRFTMKARFSDGRAGDARTNGSET